MKDFISRDKIVQLCAKTLTLYDDRLVEHGERVAYIALQIANEIGINPLEKPFDEKNILILSVFHDAGAFKTDEVDRMVEFESTDVQAHSIYGHLFLKYFTPMEKYSEVILYHHADSRNLASIDPEIRRYAELLHLSDRIDMLNLSKKSKDDITSLIDNPQFNIEMVRAAKKLIKETSLLENLSNGTAAKISYDRISKIPITVDEAELYLKMLVYSIDFKSEFTVVHSVNTTVISLYLAWYSNFSREELERMYFAALIHDVGKIEIPTSILEYPGKLSPEQMDTMRKHVVYTEEIVSNILPKEITTIAARHHEKLNGTGYPHGLSGDELSKSDRIIAVADIISALSSRRSYKDEFAKEKILSIIGDMAEKGELDKDVVALAIERFDDLERQMVKNTAPIYEIYEAMKNEHAELLSNSILFD